MMRDDVMTVGAIATAAACLVTIDHEAIGHGIACLALGGHIALLTSVYFRCTIMGAWIAAAGPAGNLVMATLAWLTFRCLPTRLSRLRLLLMIVMALGVFWEAGYVLYSVVTGEGDWAIAARTVLGSRASLWKPGGVAVGLVLYAIGMRVAASTTRSLVGGGDPAADARVRSLLRTAWIAASASACVAAATYALDRLGAIRQAFLEIGAASIPLLFMPMGRWPLTAPTQQALKRHLGWIFFALLLYAMFVATLGRGIY
jgi:hypothetical protein